MIITNYNEYILIQKMDTCILNETLQLYIFFTHIGLLNISNSFLSIISHPTHLISNHIHQKHLQE